MGLLYDSQREVIFPAIYDSYKKMERAGERLEQNGSRAAAVLRPIGSVLKWAGKSGSACLIVDSGVSSMSAALSVISIVAAMNLLPFAAATACAVAVPTLIMPSMVAGLGALVVGGAVALNHIGESIQASVDAFKGITPQPPSAYASAAAAATAVQTPSVINGTPVTTAQQAQGVFASLPASERAALKDVLAKEFDLVSREAVVKEDLANAASTKEIRVKPLKLRRG